MPTNCGSYYPGHHIHWIPVTRAWQGKPRHPITDIVANDDDSFTITYLSERHIMYFHDPEEFRRELERTGKHSWLTVGETGAIQSKGSPSRWIHLSNETVPNCALAYIQELKDNYDRAVTRTKQLIAIKELPEQSKKAEEFLTHLEYIRTLKYWDDHIISFDISGTPECSCS